MYRALEALEDYNRFLMYIMDSLHKDDEGIYLQIVPTPVFDSYERSRALGEGCITANWITIRFPTAFSRPRGFYQGCCRMFPAA